MFNFFKRKKDKEELEEKIEEKEELYSTYEDKEDTNIEESQNFELIDENLENDIQSYEESYDEKNYDEFSEDFIDGDEIFENSNEDLINSEDKHNLIVDTENNDVTEKKASLVVLEMV